MSRQAYRKIHTTFYVSLCYSLAQVIRGEESRRQSQSRGERGKEGQVIATWSDFEWWIRSYGCSFSVSGCLLWDSPSREGCTNRGSKVNSSTISGGTSGKEPACQCRRHKKPGFNPWVGKIPWRRKWQPTPLFLSRDRGAWLATVHRVTQSWTRLKRLSTHALLHCRRTLYRLSHQGSPDTGKKVNVR